MTLPYDKSAALIILPVSIAAQIEDPNLRRWLGRGALERFAAPQERLQSVLQILDRPYAADGLAALRMWGQTGDRPTVWIAAADPVYLEARLDHLCLHAFHDDALPAGELGVLFDYLQERLAGRERYGFARIGRYGYIRANSPMRTADAPAYILDQQLPNEYMPVGDATGTYHALRGEVEMALHEHDVNLQRQNAGLQPVNSLWLWGGGFAPEKEAVPHPPLFSDDPLLQGYWQSKTGVVMDWPGSISACLEASVAGFVAQPTLHDQKEAENCLTELQAALHAGRLSTVFVLLDGYGQVQIKKSDRWRFWHEKSGLFGDRDE